jgi:hypothetical protein
MPAILHSHVGQTLTRKSMVLHVPYGPHRVERRHDHAPANVPVLLIELQRPAALPAQLVHPENHHRLVLAAAQGLQGHIQRGRTAGAGILQVEHCLSSGVKFTQGTLARQVRAQSVATVKSLDICNFEAGVLQRRSDRKLSQRLLGQ